MIIKPLLETPKIKLWKSLNSRMTLSEEDAQYHFAIMKGFEGEQKCNAWIEKLSDNWLVLNDLLLEWNRTIFQLDKVLISRKTIYPLEVKNFEGDHYIENGIWYSKYSGIEIKNPLLQVERSDSVFRQLLHSLKCSYQVESNIIFINPEYYLYNAPKDLPATFPTQLNRYFTKLDKKSSPVTDYDMKLAQKLLSLHQEESPYEKTPTYHFEHLKKGIICGVCHCFYGSTNGETFVCHQCGAKEKVELAVIRSIREYQLLFPGRNITTAAILEWCQIIKSPKTMRRFLVKHYTLIGHGKSAHFVDKI